MKSLLWAQVIILLGSLNIMPLKAAESSEADEPINDLVNLILAPEEPEERESGSEDIMELLQAIYSEDINENVTAEVLSFLTSAYSEHSYLETGEWVKQEKHFHYLPYKGDLPQYTNNDFQFPIEGRITSAYGCRRSSGRSHKGIDISLNVGDTVKCVLPGVITGIGCDPKGYGNYIIVSHAGDIQTLYGHLHSSIVNLGEQMNAGDPLALGGRTGNSTGPHLHFETRYRGKPFNPSERFEGFKKMP
ncbi:MAG: M23 family metallopeptidase [Muribaculaceae bacterium]|nr:M23 family metallopeptidase [Muribaculaceae bacterium]